MYWKLMQIREPWKLMNYDTRTADTFNITLDQHPGDLRPYTKLGLWRDDYDRLVKDGRTFHQAYLESFNTEVERLMAQ